MTVRATFGLFVVCAIAVTASSGWTMELCPTCNKMISDSDWDEHVRTCEGATASGGTARVRCAWCGRMYESAKLADHQRTCPDRPPTVTRCVHCDATFPDTEMGDKQYERHLLEVHRGSPPEHRFVCPDCGMGTNSQETFDGHDCPNRAEAGSNPSGYTYWCEKCRVGTNSLETWDGHCETCESARAAAAAPTGEASRFEYWCEACQYGTNSLETWDGHLESALHLRKAGSGEVVTGGDAGDEVSVFDVGSNRAAIGAMNGIASRMGQEISEENRQAILEAAASGDTAAVQKAIAEAGVTGSDATELLTAVTAGAAAAETYGDDGSGHTFSGTASMGWDLWTIASQYEVIANTRYDWWEDIEKGPIQELLDYNGMSIADLGNDSPLDLKIPPSWGDPVSGTVAASQARAAAAASDASGDQPVEAGDDLAETGTDTTETGDDATGPLVSTSADDTDLPPTSHGGDLPQPR